MLASHAHRQPHNSPSSFNNHHHRQQPPSLQYADLPSPSAATLPLYYTTAFSSPALEQQHHHRPTPLDAFGRAQLMTTPSTRPQNPALRVRRTSATPQPTTGGSPPTHMSALTESLVPGLSWQPYEDGMGALGQRGSPAGQKRKTHQRIPSGSSVGSAGPASPYSSAVSNPYIAHSDSSLSPAGVDTSYYEQDGSLDLSKHHHPSSSRDAGASFLAPAFQNYNPQTQDPESNMEAKLAMLQALRDQQQASAEDGSPAPGFATPGRPPSSVDHRSPATPRTAAEDFDELPGAVPNSKNDALVLDDRLDSRLHIDPPGFRSTVPSLGRTMSEICQDELYNPLTMTNDAPRPKANGNGNGNKLLSPYRSVFNERLQAANNNHLNPAQSPTFTNGGDRSPFRQGSPYAPSLSSFDPRATQAGLGSAARLREQQKADAEAQALRRARPQRGESINTPKTISPKDALLDYTASEQDMKTPLFPAAEVTSQQYSPAHAKLDRLALDDADDDGASYASMSTSRRPSSSAFSNASGSPFQQSSGFAFAPPSVPGGIQLPQEYPFIAQRRRTADVDHTPDFPAHLTSMDSSMSEATVPDTSGEARKPARTTADTGTYTCTYHGCTLRFETPAKLQKHKREGHRQAAPAPQAGAAGTGDGMTSAALLRNSQAGPHKCERTNPSTGKPCNAIFSRPYDLTRHEDTIHNARKQKVRCHLCTEEKAFSRNDALTRHMRVVHPEVDFGGRSRRRHV
ncbi:MAG: hypothetical protein M1832_005261 [Thelocarpon impressellum]|nr:MAG: hypothetical protein M1832_005261 [Thelocarpon impressellum]